MDREMTDTINRLYNHDNGVAPHLTQEEIKAAYEKADRIIRAKYGSKVAPDTSPVGRRVVGYRSGIKS